MRGPDWVTVFVSLIGLGWSGWYVWSTRTNPLDDPEAAWLITPIFLILCVTGLFVLASAMPWRSRLLDVDPSEGLEPSERRSFIIGLPILAAVIWMFGFILAVCLYIPILSWVLGERSPSRLATITLGILVLIIIGFSWGLSINLPLLPYLLR